MSETTFVPIEPPGTTVRLGREDRCFPAARLRRVVEARLGFTPDEIGGGIARARPASGARGPPRRLPPRDQLVCTV